MVRGVLMFAESRMSVLQGTQCLKGQETSLDTGVGVADVVLVAEVDFLEVRVFRKKNAINVGITL